MLVRLEKIAKHLAWILPLLASIATVLVNLGAWSSLLASVNGEYALYYCYRPPFTPQYFIFIYVFLANVRDIVFVGLVLFIFVAYCLFVVGKETQNLGLGRTSIFVLPSLLLFLADPAVLPTLTLMVSISLFLSEKEEQAALLYGLAVAMNWLYILLLPSIVIMSRKQYHSLILGLTPAVVLFYFVYYYVHTIVASFLLFASV